MRHIWLVLLTTPVLASSVFAQPSTAGQVQLPLEAYTQLIESTQRPLATPRPVPASYALGDARMQVTVTGERRRAVAVVTVDLTVDVLEDEWVLVPVVPSGTPLESVTVDGQPVRLVTGARGLGWASRGRGSHRMRLVYRLDASTFATGFGLSLPMVAVASTQLTVTLPGTGLDVSVIPSAGARSEAVGGETRVTATVPATGGLQISWRVPSEHDHAVSRASFQGRLVGDALHWQGELEVQTFGADTVAVDLLPRGVTLSSVQLDGQDATILLTDGRYVTPIRGRGAHRVTLGFQVPVIRGDGPPRAEFPIPEVPVSFFELRLPGQKEVTVSPASDVTLESTGDTTLASVYVPMSRQLRLSWSEAVPADIEAAPRVNAAVYHAIHAKEGVLSIHAIVTYDVRRGGTTIVPLRVPGDVQVNQIDSSSGAVIDWRTDTGADGQRRIQVFLDRQLRGELRLTVHYDRPLGVTESETVLDLPLLTVDGAQRSRGMVALLSSSEWTLTPVEPGVGAPSPVARVGENQLPAFIRERVSRTIAHTVKFVESPAELLVTVREPDPVPARYDVQVDTLTSLGEVALTGRATIEINVKSGQTDAIRLAAPPTVNLLSLTAPSLRTYRVTTDDGQQWIDVELTQAVVGQFRVEAIYEQLLGDPGVDLEVPTLSVGGADVEQGRIAIEALTAAEVRPTVVEELAPVEVGDLPRQLVLRTTNPILLAYTYSRRDPSPRLVLGVTRHDRIATQEAVIDQADYRTLVTTDGLSVTVARFWVRNTRRQFLRFDLPPGSEIWSVFVNGRAERPASTTASRTDGQDSGAPEAVLVKIVNASEGFPLELTYATSGAPIGRLGLVEASLPRPDILVTRSRWDVYLPDGVGFGPPRTNLTVVAAGEPVSGEEMTRQLQVSPDERASRAADPLRIEVPLTGVRVRLEKLYANQPNVDAWLAMPYATVAGSLAGQLACLTGTLLLWLLAWMRLRETPAVSDRATAVLAGVAALLILVPARRYGVSLTPSYVLSFVLLATLVTMRGRATLGAWMAPRERTVT